MSDFGGSIKVSDDYEFAIIGIPFDEKSTFLKGPARAPLAIRKASSSAAINACTELGADLKKDTVLVDLGDVRVAGSDLEIFSRVEAKIKEVLDKQAKPVVLGGDHSVSYSVIKALSSEFASLDILHFDAHPDLYDEYNEDPYSHACTFARVLEHGLVDDLVQVGIRAATPQQRKKAEEHGVKMVEMKDIQDMPRLKFSNPVYMSFDIDVLDPAFAPGVSHCEPGGLSTRQLLSIVHALDADIVGMDVVEVNPEKDVSGITAAAAVKIVMEVIGKIIYSD